MRFFVNYPSELTFFHFNACEHIRQTPTSKLKTGRTCRSPHLRKALG
jgi:hypothetical protein